MEPLVISLEGKNLQVAELEVIVQKSLDDFDLRQEKKLAKQLEAVLSSLPSQLRPAIQGFIFRLKVQALPLYLDRTDILNIFREGLGSALHYDTPDIEQRLRAKFLEFPHNERDQLRQDIIAVLHQNANRITTLGPNGVGQGTVIAWLVDYDRTLGNDVISDLKVADYLFRSKATTHVPPDERTALVRLFKLYEYLKLSSSSVLGIEEEITFEEDGVIKDLNRGRPVTILDLGAKLVQDIKKTARNIPINIPTLEQPSNRINSLSVPGITTLTSRTVTPIPTIEQILKSFSLPVLDEVALKRLRTVLDSSLRGIRNDVATEEILMRSTKLGGLGFDATLTHTVLEAIHKFAPQVRQGTSVALPPKAPLAPSPSIKPAPLMPPVPKTTLSPERPAQLAQAAIVQPPPAPKPIPITIPAKPNQVPLPVSAPTPPKVTAAAPNPVITPVRPIPAPSMVDVQGKPPVAGPIDELHLFTLTDFRRLSPNAKQATARLREKIKLLEEDSYAKMTDGVQAWRSSPLNALYLALVNESLTTGQPIASIISGRQAAGQSTLTSDEFAAIRELNQQLKF